MLVIIQLALIALAALVDIYFELSSGNHLSPTPPSLILCFVFLLGGFILNAMREQDGKLKRLQAEIVELQKRNSN
jgi:hypothetical protein